MPSAAVAAAAAALVLAGVARASDPAPVALQASDWLGIDGNWSTVSFLLGSNADAVNVLVSTTLSEIWAVGPGGCLEKEPHCTAARGGVYNPVKSKHWSPMGLWQLGLRHLLYNANGQYGLDTLNAYSPITDIGFGMSNVLISAINTTRPFLGFFGLGIQPGRFGNMAVDPPLTQAVKTFGWIPSYSYGYTAGAHYRNTVVSATLGGYDTARFVPHDTTFTLTQGESIPRTLVRGIQVAANDSRDKPSPWNSTTQILSDWGGYFTAMIDSSTPYLWLPEAVCDRFAQALNLTYNTTLDLYTLPNELYREYTSNDSLTFTFSLTSFDNHDNFGLPLQVPGLVNITLPLRAFVGLLTYPFHDEAIKYGDPAVPYFTLRKSPGGTFIIGRTFLQESYIITKFDEARFSVHQALFPAKPEADAKLVPIKQRSNSPYPPPPQPKHNDRLNTREMAGIAVGAVLLCLVVLAGCCCYLRRRRLRRIMEPSELDDNKESASSLAPDSPRTPISRILSKIARRKQSRRTVSNTADASQLPSEAPDCQIFELPAPVPPAELDGATDDNSDNAHNLSAYELARRNLDRQLQGPVPEYTPPADGTMPAAEKALPDLRPSAACRLTTQPSPISPTRPHGADSISTSSLAPSPISPRTDWNTYSTELSSPATASMPPISFSTGAGSRGGKHDSLSAGASRFPSVNSTGAASPVADLLPLPAASFQRTPISPSKIVCLGPLPQRFHINPQSMLPRVAGPVHTFSAISLASEGSLGSNYTEEEEKIVEQLTRQASLSPARLSQSNCGGQDRPPRPPRAKVPAQTSETRDFDSEYKKGRIDPAKDLVHVPQLAHKRYSWEEERQGLRG